MSVLTSVYFFAIFFFWKNYQQKKKKTFLSQNRDATISQQARAMRVQMEVKAFLKERRLAFDGLVAHIEQRHEKQRRQLASSQERRIEYDRTLLALECRHLDEDGQSAAKKRYQAKLNHTKAVDKKYADQLRETQFTELRQQKEKFDFEMMAYEDLQLMKAVHFQQLCDLESEQNEEYAMQKESVMTLKDQMKTGEMDKVQRGEMRRAMMSNKQRLKALLQNQREKLRSGNLSGSSLLGMSFDGFTIRMPLFSSIYAQNFNDLNFGAHGQHGITSHRRCNLCIPEIRKFLALGLPRFSWISVSW